MYMYLLLYPPPNELEGGVYWNQLVCPSMCALVSACVRASVRRVDSCGRNSSYSFSCMTFKLCTVTGHDGQMCMKAGILNPSSIVGITALCHFHAYAIQCI